MQCRMPRAAGLSLCAVVLLGCGAPKSHETLVESIRTFNEGVRWERFSVAATSVPPAERSAFVRDMDERAEDLKITDYDIITVDKHRADEAHVQVKWSWYRTSEGTLHETHADETWERHGDAWWIVDTTLVRGADMPGVADRDGTHTAVDRGVATSTPTR